MKKWSLFGVQFNTILLFQCASEIWPDNWSGLRLEGPYKRGGLRLEGPYKRGGLRLEGFYKRGGLRLEGPYKRGGLRLEGPYKRGTTILILEVDVKRISVQ